MGDLLIGASRILTSSLTVLVAAAVGYLAARPSPSGPPPAPAPANSGPAPTTPPVAPLPAPPAEPLPTPEQVAQIVDGNEKIKAVAKILPDLAKTNLDQAISLVRSLDDITSSYISSAITRVAESNPPPAAELAAEIYKDHPNAPFHVGNSTLTPLFYYNPEAAIAKKLGYWAKTDDPAALLAWANNGGDPETIKIAHSYALEATLKADPSSLPTILAQIAEPSLREDTVADAVRLTRIEKSPPPEIATWVAALPADVQPRAALDVFRSVRYENPDNGDALLAAWQSDSALAAPLAEFIVSEHIRKEDFASLNRFLLKQHSTNSPLHPIAREAIPTKNLAPQNRAAITKDLPEGPPLNIAY